MTEIEPAADAAPVDAPEKGIDASIDRALSAAFAEKEETPAAEAPETAADDTAEGPARGPDGKFVARQQQETSPDTDSDPAPVQPPVDAPGEAPAWLADPAAKADWAKVPAPVQAQVSRRIGELETGLTQYRRQWEPLKQFAQHAEQSGTTLAQAMQNYVGIEQQLRADPIAGLNTICQNMGLDLRQVAAHIAGQPHDVNQEAQQLRQEVARLRGVEQQFQSFKQTAMQRAETDAQATVTQFAAEHPRFDELTGLIGWALQSGLALDERGQPSLQLAYEYAERLKPAPQAAPAALPPAQTRAASPASAQTRKADISIQGAPGSNPGRPKSRNVDEAIDRAFGQVGL